MSDIEARIVQLRAQLRQADTDYYVRSSPTLSDFEYDALMRELQQAEKEHPEFDDPDSPTKRVGSDLSEGFVQEKHRYPMLSLGNTYNEGDVQEFFNRTQRLLGEEFEIVCELKFDGTSLSLTYEHGRLIKALTRGDGEKGDNVTANVRTIRSIPLQLTGDAYPDFFEIRGEVLMPWQVFEDLNREREAQEEPLLANPRNAASGTLKQLNPKIVAARRLDAYLYSLLGDSLPADKHYDNLQAARSWGFRVSEHMRVCRTLDEVMDFIHYWDTERRNLPVATDGIVLKVNSLKQQQELGLTAKSPRWAIAYKFQAERACTRLESVSFQVGRQGTVTPVANLSPVQLSGTVVKRATLHNADFMAQLDLRLGDRVYVEKGGEIIPKIVGVDLDARSGNVVREIPFIEKCPECGTPLVHEEGEAAWYCPNADACPPQIKGRIEHFVSRKAMNIEGIGEEIISMLYERGLLHGIADLYRLKAADVAALEGMGKKSASNLMKSLEASRKVPFERVLFALGIRFVGVNVARKLSAAFRNIDALMDASAETLAGVDEIGEKIAGSVVGYFADADHLALVEFLRSQGLQMAVGEDRQPTGNALQGLGIVISGVFTRHSRDEYKAIIEANGGKNLSSVSARTSFILAGDNMGPAKREKAEALGVRMVSEEEFLAMLPAEDDVTPSPAPAPKEEKAPKEEEAPFVPYMNSLF